MRHAIAVLSVLAVVPTVPAAGQSDQPLWTLNTDRYIVFQRVTPQGVFVVSTEGALHGVDTATGRVLWTRSDIPNTARYSGAENAAAPFGTAGTAAATQRASLDALWDSPYGVVTIDSAGERVWVEVIDLRTGARRWDSRALPVRDVGGFFQLLEHGLLLLYGRAGGPGAPRRVWTAVDVETGTLRCENDALLRESPVEFETDGSGLEASRGMLAGHQWPVLDSESTAVLFLSEEGPVKIDLRSGTRLWASTATVGQPPALVHDYPPLLLAGGVLYAPFERSLQAFAVADGRPRWPKPRKFKGQVAQLELTGAGLLVRGAKDWVQEGRRPMAGKPFLDLVDPATGESLWPKQEKLLEVTTPFVRDGASIYAATRDKLYRVSLSDGEPLTLAELKFRGGERPEGLELRNGKLLLLANHNLALYETTGAQQYQAYFEPPGTSVLLKAAAVALAVAAVYALASSSEYGYYYVPGVPPPAPPRFRRFAADYFYVVAAHVDSAASGGPGVLKVNKDTGKGERHILLGDKSPDYKVDGRGGLLFFKRDDQRIDCYRF